MNTLDRRNEEEFMLRVVLQILSSFDLDIKLQNYIDNFKYPQ